MILCDVGFQYQRVSFKVRYYGKLIFTLGFLGMLYEAVTGIG